MCGRFDLSEKVTDLSAIFRAEPDFPGWTPRYSIAPTNTIPIVRERDGLRKVIPARWDFHPGWMKDSKRPQFNSRIETVNSNGLWKSAFRTSRCIVPMNGYFEWTTEVEEGREVKQPHFLHGTDVLAAAGLATAREVDGVWKVSTSIITREARDASGEIHDRMPAFLTDDIWDEWLVGDLATEADQEHMLTLLRERSGVVASTIRSYPVSRRINNARTADPSDGTLVDPLS